MVIIEGLVKCQLKREYFMHSLMNCCDHIQASKEELYSRLLFPDMGTGDTPFIEVARIKRLLSRGT
jgi:hypothetical protein